MDELTPRQEQILKLIREQVASSGMPPTRAEIHQQSSVPFQSEKARIRTCEGQAECERYCGAHRTVAVETPLTDRGGFHRTAANSLNAVSVSFIAFFASSL